MAIQSESWAGHYRHIESHIGHSVRAKQRLTAIQGELGLPMRSVIQTVWTHNTAHAAVDVRLLLCQPAWPCQMSICCTLWYRVKHDWDGETIWRSDTRDDPRRIFPLMRNPPIYLFLNWCRNKTVRLLQASKPCRRPSLTAWRCLVLATVLDPCYKGKAFTSAETLEWQKEGAAHDMAKTVEEIGGGGSSRKSGPISLQLVWNVCMQNVLEQLIAQSKLKN